MAEALELAQRAAEEGEVPVGAVVVIDDEIVGRGYNRREIDSDPTAHAEMIAIREAAAKIGGWRLDGAGVYVTLEPCPMCAGAMMLARIARLVFGAFDPKAGAAGTLFNLPTDERFNHNFEVTGGIMQEECSDLLSSFFKKLRS